MGRSSRSRMITAALAVAVGLSSPAWGVSSAPSSDLPDLAAIRAQIYGADYEKAIAALLKLAETDKHAEIYNLLGYSHRQLGAHDEAARWYREALFLDPGHRGALEYQGELFIATGDLDKARENLRYLEILCGDAGCAELDTLREALAKAQP